VSFSHFFFPSPKEESEEEGEKSRFTLSFSEKKTQEQNTTGVTSGT
jgi:hypothetical protein